MALFLIYVCGVICGALAQLEFNPPLQDYHPNCMVTATCTQNLGGFNHWEFSGTSCVVNLDQSQAFCSTESPMSCGPFTATNEDTGATEPCTTSFLTFSMSEAINGTTVQCSTTGDGTTLVNEIEAVLTLKAPPSAPTLNPPLCSAINETSALVTVSWVNDGYGYTLDGVPIDCTLQNPCQIDRPLQFSESHTLTVNAIDSPSSSCGDDLVSEGSVLEADFEGPSESPTVAVSLTFQQPPICSSGTGQQDMTVSATFSPMNSTLNDDIECLDQYMLTLATSSASSPMSESVNSNCCQGENCTCEVMFSASGMSIGSNDQLSFSLSSLAQGNVVNCPPIDLNDFSIGEVLYTADRTGQKLSTCPNCSITIYESDNSGVKQLIPSEGFAINLAVDYTYEVVHVIDVGDCVETLTFMGNFRADCGVTGWCDDCAISECSSESGGRTANFVGFERGSNVANVSELLCRGWLSTAYTESPMMCSDDNMWVLIRNDGSICNLPPVIVIPIVAILLLLVLVTQSVHNGYAYTKREEKGARDKWWFRYSFVGLYYTRNTVEDHHPMGKLRTHETSEQDVKA